MPVDTLAEFLEALASSHPDLVVGTPESDWIEFKSEPYRLNLNDFKTELAKDVSAFANSGGGIIVIGFQTQRDANSAQDIVTTINPVPQGLIDIQQYKATIEQRTYPPIRTSDIRWWCVENGSGILTIYVPGAADSEFPVLVSTIREDNSIREVLVGLFQRYGDAVGRTSISQLHSQIQLGRILERSGISGSPSLQASPTGPEEEERARRLQADTQHAELEGHRRFFLQAWPLANVEVRQLHDTTATGLRTILANPPQGRERGFGLRTLVTSAAVLSDGGIAFRRDRILLTLQRNGLFTVIVPANSVYLVS